MKATINEGTGWNRYGWMVRFSDLVMLDEFILDKEVPKDEPDMCGCSNCGWKGKCSDCDTEMESEGWEYPSYMIHVCPHCDDGCIDDYWYSSDDET